MGRGINSGTDSDQNIELDFFMAKKKNLGFMIKTIILTRLVSKLS